MLINLNSKGGEFVLFKKYRVKKIQKLKERETFEKQKGEAYELVRYLSNECHDLSLKWRSMLIKQNKMKVIKSSSVREFEAEYNEFMKTIRNDGKGRLGSLWSMEAPKLIYKDEFIIYSIDYVLFGLKEGISEEEYNSAIIEYDKMSEKYKSIQNEYDNKYSSNKGYIRVYTEEEIEIFKAKLVGLKDI